MANPLMSVPQSLRPIAHYIKIGAENELRDPIINYWCLFYSVQTGMAIDKKSPEALQYLTSLLSRLEDMKKTLVSQEALSQDMVAQAHIENFAMKLFEYADKNDRQSNFSKSVVKSFYTAGHLIDVLTLFGDLDENLSATRKYAKWKATYIHNCLKNGEIPKPGPAGEENDELQDYGLNVPRDLKTSDASAHAPGGFSDGVDNLKQPRFDSPIAHPQPSTNQSYEEEAKHPETVVNSVNKSAICHLTMDDYMEAQKLAKYAVSALSYEDANTAIESMTKAIAILQNKN